MIIPSFLKKGAVIGVTAMSHPADEELDRVRFEHGAKMLQAAGYETIFTDNVFACADRYGRSSTGEERARQLHELLKKESVQAVYSAGGGDFLAEMLPYVDLEVFRTHPKWIQGYSDNTSILYYLTTKADVATAYGANFGDFGMQEWDLSVSRGLQVLEGSCRTQESFETYQDGFGKRETGLEGYSQDRKVVWRCLSDRTASVKKVSFEGRLLGGCMDVLLNIAGTPYDGTKEFIERYQNDGIIYYLESFDLHFEQMMEGLWKMKELGWFRNVRGILFGRPLFYREEGWDGTILPSYEEVILERLADLQVPIVTGADIGHKGPQFVMINGAMARVECFRGKGAVTYLWEQSAL